MTAPLPPLQASKWLQIQILIDLKEMENLFVELSPFEIYQVGNVTEKGKGRITQEDFLGCYSRYIEALKKGHIPEELAYRPYFSSIFTLSSDHLFIMAVDHHRELLRVLKPSIQLQPHQLDYSEADQKFHPKVFGIDSILWGIQFSYPQLFRDPQTQVILDVDENPAFPNTALFKTLQRWVRHHTIPTPFIVNEKVINVPMRLGKHCLNWINQHPQLVKKGIRVKQ